MSQELIFARRFFDCHYPSVHYIYMYIQVYTMPISVYVQLLVRLGLALGNKYMHVRIRHYCLSEVVCLSVLFLQSLEATGVLVRAGGREKLVKPLLNILFRNDSYSKFQVTVSNNYDKNI